MSEVLEIGRKMKEKVVQDIYDKLVSLGFSPVKGGDSDVSVVEPALNVKLGFAPKKMSFEFTVLVNEIDKAIYFYEKANENNPVFASKAGLPTGIKSVSRKVKGSFTNEAGEIVKYDFDLGELPKIIRAIGEKHGYMARKVTRKASAQYQ